VFARRGETEGGRWEGRERRVGLRKEEGGRERESERKREGGKGEGKESEREERCV